MATYANLCLSCLALPPSPPPAFLCGYSGGPPFIAVAAASGALYALAPQIEKIAYSHVLTVEATETRLALDEQVALANNYVGQELPVAVRPAVAPGTTTRVMYADETLGASTANWLPLGSE